MLRDQFEGVLAEFSDAVKLYIALDDDSCATFAIDDEIIATLQYLDESDTIVLFAPVGAFGDAKTPDAGEKALELLRLCEPCGAARGFTLMLDEDAELVLAADRRHALEIASADSLAAWVEALVSAVRAVREIFAEKFPVEEEGRS